MILLFGAEENKPFTLSYHGPLSKFLLSSFTYNAHKYTQTAMNYQVSLHTECLQCADMISRIPGLSLIDFSPLKGNVSKVATCPGCPGIVLLSRCK